MGRLLRRLRYFLRQRQFETDLAEEMDFHREMKEQEFKASGAETSEATLAARRALGSVWLARENARAVWLWPWLEAFVRDMRFGARLLLKNPGFAAIAVMTLAVAIGANTAVYTLVDHALMRPLPYPEPDRLATVVRHYELGTTSGEGYSQNGATWLALRDNVPALDIAVDGGVGGVNLVAGDHTAYIQQQRVSAGFFRVLGVTPALGREFTADEDQVGGPAVAVLSHPLWLRAFAGDVNVIGRQVTLRGEPFTVVGVMPPGFGSNAPADVWTPVRPSTQGEGGGQNYLLVVRIKPGLRWADVSGQLESIGSAILREVLHPPPDIRLTMRLVPFQQSVTFKIRKPLLILWAAVGMVLLIGCVNIAGLMLVRCSARGQEIATRIALGGGRTTIVRQLLAESFVLAVCGGITGIALGYALVRAISVRLQEVISLPIIPDLRVLMIAMAASLLTTVLFGLFPAFQASRTDVRRMLVEGGGSAIAGPARRWPARLLVGAEAALGIVLVVGAGLLIRTLSYLSQLRPGFDTTNVITGRLSLQDARYQTATRVNDLFTRSIDRIRLMPGVERAAVALALPYERALNEGWRFQGEANAQQEPISLTYVTPEYFNALRIPVMRGRVLSDRDTSASTLVLVVNEAFVRRYSRDADVIGRRMMFGHVGTPAVEIVGVVGDIQQRVNFGNYGPVSAVPAAYVPASQVGDGGFKLAHTWFEPSWIVRTTSILPTIIPAMQRALREIDPQLLFNKFRTIDDVRGEAVTGARIQAALLGALAAVALVLCALGVYGLVAYSVAERQREFGVRIALGATASEILKAATAPGIAFALSGAAVGLVLAAAVARVMQGLVFGVFVRDPVTFTVAAGVVISTACSAAFVAALRTLRVNVIAVLNSR